MQRNEANVGPPLTFTDLLVYSENYTDHTGSDVPYTFEVPLAEPISDVYELELVQRQIPIQTITRVKIRWGRSATQQDPGDTWENVASSVPLDVGDDLVSVIVTVPNDNYPPTLPARLSVGDTESTDTHAIITAWDDVYVDATDGLEYRYVYVINITSEFAAFNGNVPGVRYLRCISSADGSEAAYPLDPYYILSERVLPIEMKISMSALTSFKQARSEGISPDTFWVFTKVDLDFPAIVIRRHLTYPIETVRSLTITLQENDNPYQIPVELLDTSTTPYVVTYRPSFFHFRIWHACTTISGTCFPQRI